MSRPKKEPKITYNTQQEAAIAKDQLLQLLNHAAWRRIVLYYKKKIEFHNNELLSKEITTIQDLNRIRDKINLCTQMMNLPDIMIGQIEINSDEEKISFDPFA